MVIKYYYIKKNNKQYTLSLPRLPRSCLRENIGPTPPKSNTTG
jgi:hypothetical protein